MPFSPSRSIYCHLSFHFYQNHINVFILISGLYYALTLQQRPSAKEKNFPLHILQHQPANRQTDFYFIFVYYRVEGQVGFLLYQPHVPCSLISRMALLSFVLGKLQIEFQKFQWEVTEITPLACTAHLSCIAKLFVNDWSAWKEVSVAVSKNLLVLRRLRKLRDWGLMRMVCQRCRRTAVDSRL